jgi:hypothetical protein
MRAGLNGPLPRARGCCSPSLWGCCEQQVVLNRWVHLAQHPCWRSIWNGHPCRRWCPWARKQRHCPSSPVVFNKLKSVSRIQLRPRRRHRHGTVHFRLALLLTRYKGFRTATGMSIGRRGTALVVDQAAAVVVATPRGAHGRHIQPTNGQAALACPRPQNSGWARVRWPRARQTSQRSTSRKATRWLPIGHGQCTYKDRVFNSRLCVWRAR